MFFQEVAQVDLCFRFSESEFFGEKSQGYCHVPKIRIEYQRDIPGALHQTPGDLRFRNLCQGRDAFPFDEMDHQLGVVKHGLDEQSEKSMIVASRDGRVNGERMGDTLFPFLYG